MLIVAFDTYSTRRSPGALQQGWVPKLDRVGSNWDPSSCERNALIHSATSSGWSLVHLINYRA